MGINSVNGQDLTVRLASRAAPTPAPQLRPGEAAPGGPPARRPPPAPDEDRAPRRAAQELDFGPQATSTRLRVDKETKRIVAQILDGQGEVIRQIPPEEFLELSVRFRRLEGLLFDRKG